MHQLKNLVPQSIKNIYHLAQAIIANFWYGFPSKKIKIIGVTGTNGKTTTVQMIAKILEEAGRRVAVASTINFRIDGEEEINKTKFTTLSSFAVQKFIKKAVTKGCEYLILETSSHSLDQYRVWGINYKTAVITNVTREHLDYHETMEKYRKAKTRLFKDAKIAIVNLDMERPEEFLAYKNLKNFLYSNKYDVSGSVYNDLKNNFDDIELVRAENVELGIQDTGYRIKNVNFKLNLLGLFNVENALAATCVGLSEDISLEGISKALEKIKIVPGRLENIINDKGINTIVDYAVTPDSLEKLYELIEKINVQKNKVIAVFGSCGERDRGKRPIMGEIVSKYADFVIVTNEDPYNEDPTQIINEVALGIKNKTEGENFWKILDRREAIEKALQIAKMGDFVIVTGKGAEETMAVGRQRIPWNDKVVIKEELEKLK